MKPFLIAFAFVTAFVAARAADREWQVGQWARPAPAPAAAPSAPARGSAARPPSYAIETDAVRLELQDTHPPAERRVVAARVDTPVRFAVEGDTVYVVIGGDIEYALHVAKTIQKSPAKPVAADYNAFGGGHFIKTVSQDGKLVTLEDGSVWEVDPRGWYLTLEWQPQALISVRRARAENGFAYEVQNLDVDEGVLAKYVPRQ